MAPTALLAQPAPPSTVATVDMPPPARVTSAVMLDNAINKVMSKKLLNGYASFLMEQGDFHNWIHLAKESEEVWPWMVSFTEDLLDVENSHLFDECCRHVMDRLVPFGRDAMLHRENKSADGYEYKLFH